MASSNKVVVVQIDGEPIRLHCPRLTVREYGRLARLSWGRGAVVQEDLDLVRRRMRRIDALLCVEPGDLLVDGEVITSEITRWFGAREDVIATLYDALLASQQPNEQERHNLEVAARFSDWLGSHKESGSHWVQTGTSCQRCHELRLCDRRGCDGTSRKKPVWHDDRLVLTVCPVLSYTRDVEEAVRLFYWSHVFTQYSSWQQIHLISSGGVEDQDAWLSGAFGYLRAVHTQLFTDAMKRSRIHARTKH